MKGMRLHAAKKGGRSVTSFCVCVVYVCTAEIQ